MNKIESYQERPSS